MQHPVQRIIHERRAHMSPKQIACFGHAICCCSLEAKDGLPTMLSVAYEWRGPECEGSSMTLCRAAQGSSAFCFECDRMPIVSYFHLGTVAREAAEVFACSSACLNLLLESWLRKRLTLPCHKPASWPPAWGGWDPSPDRPPAPEASRGCYGALAQRRTFPMPFARTATLLRRMSSQWSCGAGEILTLGNGERAGCSEHKPK